MYDVSVTLYVCFGESIMLNSSKESTKIDVIETEPLEKLSEVCA